LRALLEYWEESHGTGSIRALSGRLPEAFVKELVLDTGRPGFGVLAGGWYSCEAAGALLEELLAPEVPQRRDEVLQGIAEEVMGRTLKGVHRAIFRVVGSPELMRLWCQFFWNQQFDTGAVSIDGVEPGYQIHHYRNWSGHHPLLCQFAFGCVPPMFRAMGIEDCRMEAVSCISAGADECVARIRWDA